MWATVGELETQVGAQVRARRLRAERTADEVAGDAGVATKTLLNLERGKGSTLATLVKVLRVLDAEDWLTSLTPPTLVSPVAILEAARSQQPPRRRVRRSNG